MNYCIFSLLDAFFCIVNAVEVSCENTEVNTIKNHKQADLSIGQVCYNRDPNGGLCFPVLS